MRSASHLKVFTTCPPSALDQPKDCIRRIENVARWSEAAGCEGILVFSDNRQLDPWLVSRVIIDATERLCPLVAVQPAYCHPYTVAKTIASFGFLYGRRVCLNMVAGGFVNDMAALGDTTPHDDRYVRLVEYTKIVQGLLRGTEPVTFEGRYYKVANLKMVPPLARELESQIFVSGSSEAGRAAARELDAVAVEYPTPDVPQADTAPDGRLSRGIRIGLIVRNEEARAWAVARERFPEDRKGQLTRQLATKVSDSRWHGQLSELAEDEQSASLYWMAPFKNYKAMCPYLVGSYERVAAELASYIDRGYANFILDEPADEEELHHVRLAFELATEQCAAA
jgi:alkanesulfonate monooxygenase